MSRLRPGRNAPTFGPVASYPVAEHRYLWNAPCPDRFPETFGEIIAAAPYKAGEVALAAYGAGFHRVMIIDVFAVKDRFDDWREAYRVARETKKGEWAKVYYVCHPGYIQRGYQRAGQAPEMPGEEE